MVLTIFAVLIGFIVAALGAGFVIVAIFESAGKLDSDTFNEEE